MRNSTEISVFSFLFAPRLSSLFVLFLPVGLAFQIQFFSHLRCQAHFLCGLDKKCRQLTVKKVCKNKMTESVEQAFKKGHIGKRQHKALKKHAERPRSARTEQKKYHGKKNNVLGFHEVPCQRAGAKQKHGGQFRKLSHQKMPGSTKDTWQ